MDNPAKKIIDRIKEEHVVPESKFKLNWKSYLFWSVWGLTISLGALFFSLIILNFLDIQPEVFHYLKLRKFMVVLLVTAPYLWIGLALLALISGFLAIRKTKRGYRYSVLFVTSLGVLVISIAGMTFHMAKINEKMRVVIFRGMPESRGVAFPMEKRWSRPNEKMLGGEIIDLKPNYFMLINFKDETWEVQYSPETKMKIEGGQLAPGLRVGIIGEKIEERKFKAEFIHSFPFEGMGKRRMMIKKGSLFMGSPGGRP